MRQRERRLLLNAFTYNTVTLGSYGTWRLDRSRQTELTSLDSWLDLARTLERGKFDAIFFADIPGIYSNYQESSDLYIKEALQFPNLDPAVLIPALAKVTDHLGLVLTSSVLQEPPFIFARKMSTLDHYTNGRVGWNIVTSPATNAYANLNYGHWADPQTRDERYVIAEEYLEVVYKLWEGSWDDGAVIEDKVNGIYADPGKIHKIHHQGERFQVEGPHLTPPSPQRTPFLFQAGQSGWGRDFAARHAEATFINAPTLDEARHLIAATLDVARAKQRSETLKFFQIARFVVGSTEAEVKSKLEELDAVYNPDAAVAHLGAMW